MKEEKEIERRFLLKRLPRCDWDDKFGIEQFYVTEKDDPIIDRYRLKIIDLDGTDGKWFDYEATHTIKTRISDMSNNEKEGPIEFKEYKEQLENSLRWLSKDRYILKEGVKDGLKWEVDIFISWGMKMVIAEIEIPSEDYELEIPEAIQKEIVMEITGMKEFSNSNLAD